MPKRKLLQFPNIYIEMEELPHNVSAMQMHFLFSVVPSHIQDQVLNLLAVHMLLLHRVNFLPIRPNRNTALAFEKSEAYSLNDLLDTEGPAEDYEGHGEIAGRC